jgi:hypothetical protein
MKSIAHLRRPAALGVSAGFALAAALAAAPALAKDKYEALAAGIQITEEIGAPTQECYAAGGALTGYISGNGLATAIGDFKLTSTDCISSATQPPQPPFSFSSTDFTLAATGGTIRATYTGTATPVSELTPWLLALKGTVTFTGGTGAYSKVKGGGTLTGVEDISPTAVGLPARGFVTLSGQISR